MLLFRALENSTPFLLQVFLHRDLLIPILGTLFPFFIGVAPYPAGIHGPGLMEELSKNANRAKPLCLQDTQATPQKSTQHHKPEHKPPNPGIHFKKLGQFSNSP